MSQKYKHVTGIELIKNFCAKILCYGLRNGLDVNGVKVWVSPQVAEILKMGDFLAIDIGDNRYIIPVVINDNIKEIPLGNEKYQTDILVGNPDWTINLAEGEFWFEH